MALDCDELLKLLTATIKTSKRRLLYIINYYL